MPHTPPPGWIETQATVTTCRFQFARMNTFTLGFQTGDKYRITFDYYAHGQLYSGEFQSPKAIPQNETIPLHYNPFNPQENDRASNLETPGRSSIFLIGVAGSIVLSLAWLAVLRGCQ